MADKKSLLLFILCICLPFTCGTVKNSDLLIRSRRQLLFPNSTVLQFNVGIATPSPSKNVNFNFAFQANFQLPWNRTQIPTDILNANSGYDGDSRKKREVKNYGNDAKLFHLYKYVEELLTSFGYDGKSCMRRALCHIGAEPLHSEDEEDLLHELAEFILNPTHDADANISERNEAYPYILAYQKGQAYQDCSKLYSKCKINVLDMFTRLNNLS